MLVTNNQYNELPDYGEGKLGKDYDAIAFGRAYLANPDLPTRWGGHAVHARVCSSASTEAVLCPAIDVLECCEEESLANAHTASRIAWISFETSSLARAESEEDYRSE